MNLPFSLIPGNKREMYFFAYGAMLVSVFALAFIINLVFNVNTGLEPELVRSLQNVTINVRYSFRGGV